jgi:hypothetical protein
MGVGSSLEPLSADAMKQSGYCLWVFRSGAWDLMRSACAEGYVPGAPPSQAGQFEGQVVRKCAEPDLRPAVPVTAGA